MSKGSKRRPMKIDYRTYDQNWDTIFRPKPEMWDHNCPKDGMISVAKGQPCNWCGSTESLDMEREL